MHAHLYVLGPLRDRLSSAGLAPASAADFPTLRSPPLADCSLCIRRTLKEFKLECPACRAPGTEADLKPNHGLEAVVGAFRAARSRLLTCARLGRDAEAAANATPPPAPAPPDEDEVLEPPRSPDERAIIEFAAELQDRCPESFGTFSEYAENADRGRESGCRAGGRWGGDPFSWSRVLTPEWFLRGVDQDSLSAAVVTRPPLFDTYSHSYVRNSSESRGDGAGFPPGILFYSAFFTSVWLWIYAASVLVSRVLLQMNSGVGFLLRVTDVERQPFRSMGFVSVIIVSVLFALGLPLVLL